MTGPPTPDAPDPRTGELPAYDLLVRQYLEATLRIERLKAWLEALAKRFEQVAHDGWSPVLDNQRHVIGTGDLPSRVQALENRGLVARLQQLEQRLDAPDVSDASPNGTRTANTFASGLGSSPSHRDTEAAQLRLQVSSLASQLAQTEGRLRRLRQANGRHGTRDRRNGHSKWEFWRGWKRD